MGWDNEVSIEHMVGAKVLNVSIIDGMRTKLEATRQAAA